MNPRPPACKAGILPVYTISPIMTVPIIGDIMSFTSSVCDNTFLKLERSTQYHAKGFIRTIDYSHTMVLLESQRSLKKDDAPPDFELLGIDGKTHSLADYASYDGLLVIFMCNHCPYVKAKINAIKEVHQVHGKRVAVVGINSNDAVAYPDDDYESMKTIAAKQGIEFDYLVDESQEIARKYGATCTPDPFLFDANMKLVFHGRIDNAMKPEDTATEKTMIKNISTMLEGQTIEQDFNPSIGCSIKWKEN